MLPNKKNKTKGAISDNINSECDNFQKYAQNDAAILIFLKVTKADNYFSKTTFVEYPVYGL
jgi:hypothetical protein